MQAVREPPLRKHPKFDNFEATFFYFGLRKFEIPLEDEIPDLNPFRRFKKNELGPPTDHAPVFIAAHYFMKNTHNLL